MMLVTACSLMPLAACASRADVLTFSGSAVGSEGAVVRRQLERFAASHPALPVQIRVTPDAADQRHQLYVQWLNAWTPDPDVLQLDVIWAPEFAAAGWIQPLDGFDRSANDADFFSAPLRASRWLGHLYAIPWFVDVGMLYWRTDLLAAPPATFDALVAASRDAIANHRVAEGFVWEGARYEGLVAVFLEHLAGFGGRILDDDGRVAVDTPEAIRALTFMRRSIDDVGVVPARGAVRSGSGGAPRPRRPRHVRAVGPAGRFRICRRRPHQERHCRRRMHQTRVRRLAAMFDREPVVWCSGGGRDCRRPVAAGHT